MHQDNQAHNKFRPAISGRSQDSSLTLVASCLEQTVNAKAALGQFNKQVGR